MKILPVTIVSGFMSAGKTTVLQHVLQNSNELRVAAISNNVEGNDLLNEIAKRAGAGQFDYVLIESAGTSEPMHQAERFLQGTDEQHAGLCDIAAIDTMVTIVDATSFLDDLQSVEELRDRRIAVDDDGNRDIARLLVDQIEFANVILLNKTDLVSEEDVGQLLAILRALNPLARVLAIEHGKVPVEDVVNTGRFQLDWAAGADAWPAELAGDDREESTANGISSFVYRARRPFHPQRFWDFWMVGEYAPNVLRSKGYFWLATKNAMSGFWSHAGQVLAAEPGGTWWAETPRAEWPTDDPDLLAELQSVWEEPWGDRRQELMIIVQDLNSAVVREALNACLLTDHEMNSGPSAWVQLEDPFGSWNEEHVCDGSPDHDHG